jgi:hypothetical protein
MQVRNEERALIRKNGAGCRNTDQLGLKPVLIGFMA